MIGYRQMTLILEEPDHSKIFPLLISLEIKGNATSKEAGQQHLYL